MQCSARIFSNRDISKEIETLSCSNNEDPCDKCGKNITFGAFVDKDIITPKIATNEAYVCKECYDSLNLNIPYDHPSHVRFLDLEVKHNEEMLKLGNSNQFMTVWELLPLVDEIN